MFGKEVEEGADGCVEEIARVEGGDEGELGEDGGEFGFDKGEVVGVLVDGGALEEEGLEGALDELHGGGLAEGEGFGGGRRGRGGGRGREGDYVFTFVLF